MLDDRARRRAARAVILSMIAWTGSRTMTEAAEKVGISQTTPSQWGQRGKTPPVGIGIRTVDKIVARIPDEQRTPETVALLHRLAARTCGYDV